MSEVPSNTPKRQAIVERLRQRIDCFRKRHDSCQARLEETQPSRELKQLQESRICQAKISENKVKMNAKIRPEQINKLPKQEDLGPESKTVASNNTGLQATIKRKFPSSDGERGLQNNDDTPVPQKYARFENEVHCNVKPAFNTGEETSETLPPLPSSNMPYGTLNGHGGEFVKSEDLGNAGSAYSASCDNMERTMPRVSQQYGAADFASATFTSRGQSGEKSRTPEFTTFKQENGLLSPNNDKSTSNGLLTTRTKNEDEFRLLTDIENNTNTSKEDDLENQLSQFERVLQGIKSRDESSSETESSNEPTKTQIIRPQSQSLGNGLNDSPDMGKVNNNQLGLPNEANNTIPTSSAAVQQYGISRSTAQALQQFVMAQQSKVRFERSMFLNPQEQNNPARMATQRPNPFPVRQRVFQQLQQRSQRLQKSKIAGAAPLQARSPVMNPLAGNASYQMHPKVRYPPSSQQAPYTAGRMHQNIMQPLRQPVQQSQIPGQMANLPRHQINMLAQQQQQKLAFQQQIASRLPSYSQAQHLARSSVMDIRQKFSGGVPSTGQYNPVHQQAARAQQPLPHLQHYNPPGYATQSGPPSRPVQVPYNGDFPGYQQHPYQYVGNQESKLHSAYQRHTSMDDNIVVNRFHNSDMNNRNNFAYQRSSSVPSHANIFNHSSPPVVRLGQSEPNLPDVNNNGNDHPSQDMSRIHPQAPLSHMKQQHGLVHNNNLGMNQEQQLYQGNGISSLAQSRSQPPNNIQTPLSNSFSNLLDMKSNSETSLFPFLNQDLSGGTTDSADFDSLLKSPPGDFDLLNMLESEPQKALQ